MKEFDDTYDLSRGPVPSPRSGRRHTSLRQQRVPVDLGRSRRVGLTAMVCSECGAHEHEGLTRHRLDCTKDFADDPWGHIRYRTGPIAAKQTSVDTGWRAG